MECKCLQQPATNDWSKVVASKTQCQGVGTGRAKQAWACVGGTELSRSLELASKEWLITRAGKQNPFQEALGQQRSKAIAIQHSGMPSEGAPLREMCQETGIWMGFSGMGLGFDRLLYPSLLLIVTLSTSHSYSLTLRSQVNVGRSNDDGVHKSSLSVGS